MAKLYRFTTWARQNFSWARFSVLLLIALLCFFVGSQWGDWLLGFTSPPAEPTPTSRSALAPAQRAKEAGKPPATSPAPTPAPIRFPD